MIVIDANMIREFYRDHPSLDEDHVEKLLSHTDIDLEIAVEDNLHDRFWDELYDAMYDAVYDLLK